MCTTVLVTPTVPMKQTTTNTGSLLCESLRDANGIVLLTNGTGKANAGHHFLAYAQKHFSEVAAKILGEVRCDISDLTDPQLLRIGQDFVGVHPTRDHGDSRRGAL